MSRTSSQRKVSYCLIHVIVIKIKFKFHHKLYVEWERLEKPTNIGESGEEIKWCLWSSQTPMHPRRNYGLSPPIPIGQKLNIDIREKEWVYNSTDCYKGICVYTWLYQLKFLEEARKIVLQKIQFNYHKRHLTQHHI